MKIMQNEIKPKVIDGVNQETIQKKKNRSLQH